MPQPDTPIARIRLARSLPRLLFAPIIVAAAGGAAVAAGLLAATGTLTIVLVALGAMVALVGLAGAAILLSIRFEVEESAVSLVWAGGRRVYPLAPGPVTRVRLRGPNASALRPRRGALGWGIGAARLREEEEITLIRLAATRTAILIPTARRRLAVAPERDDELLEALARAAQARQRLEAQEAVTSEPVAEVEAVADVEPASLTGIERALLEERLARERAAAEAAREAAAAATAAAAAAAAESAVPGHAADGSAGEQQAAARPLSRFRAGTDWGFVLLPTIAAGVAWWAGQWLGIMPEPGTDLARLTSLALVLAGPATSVGAIMALAWWPRLVGVVVAGGLVASVFIGRALIG